MTESCKSLRQKIESCDYAGWQGLLNECTPEDMFDIDIDENWGELFLGEKFEPARSHLLDFDGYYRPIVYARNGKVVMFDGMNPRIKSGWELLSTDLGAADVILDWTHGSVEMRQGERIYSGRGI